MIASTSEMPMIMSSGGNGDGWGGGSIWAIVLIALLGFNRHGENGGREATDNAELNGRFNSLENQIDNVANREDLARNLKETCDTNMNVTEQAYGLSKQLDQNRFDTAIEFKNAELRAADCYKVA